MLWILLHILNNNIIYYKPMPSMVLKTEVFKLLSLLLLTIIPIISVKSWVIVVVDNHLLANVFCSFICMWLSFSKREIIITFSSVLVTIFLNTNAMYIYYAFQFLCFDLLQYLQSFTNININFICVMHIDFCILYIKNKNKQIWFHWQH